MKKSTLRGTIALGILLMLYHMVVLLVPFEKGGAFWISYGFTLVGFALGGGAIFMAFGKNGNAKSRFYGFPIARVGIVYMVFQLIVGLVFMAVGQWVLWWIPMLVYVVALGVALLGLIAAEATLEEIQKMDAKLKKNVATMRALQSRVCQLSGQYDHPQLKKLADEIRYSDPVSSDATAGAEADLCDLINQLQQAVVQGDGGGVTVLCSKAIAALNERNRLCKLNK